MKISNVVNKKFLSILKKLSSQPAIGGLEISDSAIRFLRIDDGKIATASLRLPPGIILDGKINDRQNFLAALKNVHSQLTRIKKVSKIHAIICLPVSVVYSQSFSIPIINHENLANAAELNLQMASPIKLEKAYSDWQTISKNTNQMDALGAFVENSIVDEYDQCLSESGFSPTAFEFPALSLCRLIKDLGPAIDIDKTYLVVNVSSDGLNFLIIRKGELYFNHFLFWRTLQGEKRQIVFSDFRDLLVQEVQKVVNFISVNYRETFEGAIIMAPALEKEVGEIIEAEFKLKIIPLRLRNYENLSSIWFTVFGSALRGLVPRREDVFISLTAHNVIEEFYHEQALSFISLWRNIFLISLSVLLVAFGGTDMFLAHIQKDTKAQISSLVTHPQTQEVGKLEEKAKFFNSLVTLVSEAKNSTKKWSAFFDQLNVLAGNNIIFDRIIVSSLTAPVRIQGRADSEDSVIDFKNNIASQSNFGSVDLPLTGIRPTADRRVSFELTFSIKSLTP
ncbi:MAG: hypothetical protein Q8N22_01955 [bacterium]|nr:hypothetical protein [bacterium]